MTFGLKANLQSQERRRDINSNDLALLPPPLVNLSKRMSALMQSFGSVRDNEKYYSIMLLEMTLDDCDDRVGDACDRDIARKHACKGSHIY